MNILKSFLQNLQFVCMLIIVVIGILFVGSLLLVVPIVLFLRLGMLALIIVPFYLAALITLADYLSKKNWPDNLAEKFIDLIPEKFKG